MEQALGLWGRGRLQRCCLVVLAVVFAAALLAASGTAVARPLGYVPPVTPIDASPPQPDHFAAALYMKTHPNATPAGTNDFACVPSPEHPRPVVLAHGTDASAYTDWSMIAPRLVEAGYCVFALNYGGRPGEVRFGTEDLILSAHQVADFVDDVLAASTADEVDLVGFSQGANVTRYYTNKLGGSDKVDSWVGLASPSYGGNMYGLAPVGEAVPGVMELFEKATSLAVVQQAEGSPTMLELNAGGDTVPGVRYVTISSRVDEMIQPFENMALRGPGAQNIVIQDHCPTNMTGHFHMVYDAFVTQLLSKALDPSVIPAPACTPVALGTGIPEVILGGNI